MKRLREEGEVDVNLASLLMLLSSSAAAAAAAADEDSNTTQPSGRVFECKTCNRQFPSFQALGGHRASHKKPRLAEEGAAQPARPPKPKVHECSICGLEFALGQALGGHMRRHRAVLESGSQLQIHTEEGKEMATAMTAVVIEIKEEEKAKKKGDVVALDLNMPPLENDPLLILSLGLPLVH